MSSRFRVPFFMFLCFAILLIGSHFASYASAGEVKTTDLTLHVDDGKGNPGEEVETFAPTDHKQHFEAEVDGDIAAGSKAKCVFTAVDTDKVKNTKVTESEFDIPKANPTSVKCSVSIQNDWPIGKYKLDVYVNGKLVGTHEYQITPEEEKENE